MQDGKRLGRKEVEEIPADYGFNELGCEGGGGRGGD